jgi:hypothetical protein
MSGISSSFWTSDHRIRERQQPRANLQFGVLRRSQIDFEADLVVPRKKPIIPLLHRMSDSLHGSTGFPFRFASAAELNCLSAMVINKT